MRNLDLNTLHQQPTMSLTLRDKNRTVLHLELATVALVERLQTAIPELSRIASDHNLECINMLYGLTADILNFNRDGITLTADSLKSVYRVSLNDIVSIFSAYLEFINEVTAEKNEIAVLPLCG